MTTKVGLTTVSYGIGVQNRYSAFLEDEDSFILSNIIKRPANEHHVVNKPKSSASAPKSGGAKAGQRADLPSNQNKKQLDGQPKSSPPHNTGQQLKGDTRRQQRDGKPTPHYQSIGSSSQPARNHNNRVKNYNQDGNPNANGTQRYPRTQYNGGFHQQADSANQNQSKENQSNYNARPMRTNGVRPAPRPRTLNEDRKPAQQQDSQQVNGHLASNDEEKARRLQKRLNNLKFKDPEKRERRNPNNDSSEQPAKVAEQTDEKLTDQRGPRNRRDPEKNRVRPPRRNPGDANGDPVKRENKRDRPIRQRSEFEGSDAAAAAAAAKPGKPKPIPNFSDKSDFPSLAS